MRAEIAVALLHKPELIFLDEPTIGLDASAKYKLRRVLKQYNKDTNTTIFLTSHDSSDIEDICERSIIINKGKIIIDTDTKKLGTEYLKLKYVHLKSKEPIEDLLANCLDVTYIRPNEVKFSVDTSKTEIGSIVKELSSKYQIVDLDIEEPTLDESIRYIYSENER